MKQHMTAAPTRKSILSSKSLLCGISLLTLSSLAQAATYDLGTTGAIGTGTASTVDTAWAPTVVGGPTASDNIAITNISSEKQINVVGAGMSVVDFSYNDTETVLFTGAVATTPNPQLNITGTLTKSGAGSLYFGSKNSGGVLNLTANNVSVTEGTLHLGAGVVGASTFKGINVLTISGNTSVSAGATLNVYHAYASGGNTTRNLGTVTLDGAMGIGVAGSTNNSTAIYRFNGLTGASTGSLTSGAQATAVTSTLQFYQTAGTSATFAGSISQGTNNTLAVTHAGGGVQTFSGNTTYTGQTSVNAGGMLVFSGTSTVGGGTGYIALTGGTAANGGSIIGLGNGDMTNRAVAVSAGSGNNVNMTSASGFAALGADRTVTFTNGALTWGSNGFAGNGATPGIVVLGHSTATHKVTLTNDINLGTVARTVIAHNGAGLIDGSLSGVISGVGASLVKDGLGALELRGDNSYTGGTTVSNGTLFVNNISGSATGTGAVAIASGAGLAGGGTISGLATTGGATSFLSPGNSAGILNLNGGLDAALGATFNFELGTSSDLLSLGSGVLTGSTASGGLLFNFSNSGGFGAGIVYTLVNFGSSSGLDYGDLLANNIVPGFTLDSSFGTDGWLINGNSLQVQFASAVPEPSAFAALTGLLAIGAAAVRRRKRQS